MKSNIWLRECLLAALLSSLFLSAQAAPFDQLKVLQDKGVAVTALAVDVTNGQVLAQLSPSQRLTPASLSKLFVAATALRQWGSAKTFTTRLLTNGQQSGTTLKGNLILVGGGDPGLVSERLWDLIGQLRAQGITRIEGDLVVDDSLFGDQPCLTPDRCHAQQSSRHAYNAGLSAAGINYGSWCVKVTPASQVGQNAQATLCPLAVPGVTLGSRAETSKQGQSLALQRVQGGRLVVTGRIGVTHAPVFLYVSASDPAQQAGMLLQAQMALAGISVTGTVKVVQQPQSGRELASLQSLPLSTLIKRMLDYSNNYMADVLTLDLLTDAGSAQSAPTLSLAAEHLQQLAQTLVAPYRLDEGNVPARLASGSGLTTDSRLSARDLVTLLQVMYRETDIFPAFVAGLTVPRYSAIGILRGPEAGWKNQVMVKSGSLNEPYTVYGIAGYARTTSGRWLAFAILLNGTAKKPVLPYADSMQTLRQTVVDLLDSQESMVP